ncbi:uncharacterized protein Z520_01046 [Fonsecaea multimorphosa CBS 102226]|uniref:Uncharacterized protein n=1 Tax=Fonsecaea multimorphosa CBS 102226 TaxID=1442371 RepID=A0A0D2HKZ5_9EURO|nr:uncharacterized protein Z520_01046 [Fonsecaea multimorphosa CBS 102226]KIY02581.1 hypothetical protein Z520_01046 [Fonsecaea multimorphosa CBS 102226]OAL31447.1 hypothetical protein AYO22_01039 [Fonsecaea multimorphosa]
MSSPDDNSQGAAYPWVLEHLLTYPNTYEIPLRTMYTLNATTQHQQQCPPTPSPTAVPGNAFPRKSSASAEEQQNMTTMTAAAQLRANLMQHILQLPSQPTSLPPSFITSFVRKCFPRELDQVDFPQALTAMDYLKDLEVRRRREVVAALDKLGIDQDDLSHRDKLARKYPGVLRWVSDIEERERKIEALYTQVYIGLRRWTLINELNLTPFDKGNCLAMLNTLYPPINMNAGHFVQPTAQLTPQILTQQRNGFFKYITAVEKNGPAVLSNLMNQAKKAEDPNGWVSLRDTLDKYVRMANNIIEECYDITGHSPSPNSTSFKSLEHEEEGRRKVDSAISFGSGSSSNRNSAQSNKSAHSQKSHTTRPSTSSSFSNGSRSHSRHTSQEKQLPEKPLPPPKDDEITVTQKPSGSTLERIARGLRKIQSRTNIKDDFRPRTPSHSSEMTLPDNYDRPPPTPAKDRSLKNKLSIRRMRSNTALSDVTSLRSPSRHGEPAIQEVPAFDADEMNRSRQRWETQQKLKGGSDGLKA